MFVEIVTVIRFFFNFIKIVLFDEGSVFTVIRYSRSIDVLVVFRVVYFEPVNGRVLNTTFDLHFTMVTHDVGESKRILHVHIESVNSSTFA